MAAWLKSYPSIPSLQFVDTQNPHHLDRIHASFTYIPHMNFATPLTLQASPKTIPLGLRP